MPYSYLTFNTNTISSGSSGILSGSYITEDLQEIYEQKILNEELYFGTSENDIIEFSLYNNVQDLISFNRVVPSVTYSILNGSYYDINQKLTNFNFARPFTNYAQYNNSILIDTKTLLNSVNLSTGLYYILYNFVRNVAGNTKNKLLIKEISPSRTELRLSYAFDPTSNPENIQDAIKISSFANKKFLFLSITNQLNNIIDNNPISKNFDNNKRNYNYFQFANNLGLKSIGDLEKFIIETYDGFDKIKKLSNSSDILIQESSKFVGIKDQLKNFTYTYNSVEFSRDEISIAFETIITKVCQDRILQRTSLSSVQLNELLNFFKKIIYTDWIQSQTNLLLDHYSDRFYGIYKNALNFDNGELFKILNHTSYVNPVDNLVNVQIKLDQPLPYNYNIRSTCWISNISISPLYFKVNFFTEPVSRKVFLSKVNFDVDVDVSKSSNEPYSRFSPESLFSVKSDLKKKINDLLIDYNNFDNFIIYSSAELRTKIAKNKIIDYNKQEVKKSIIDSKINSKTIKTISSSYSIEKDKIIKDQIELLKSFDDYESYLFFVGSSSIDKKIEDGINYDTNNLDSLMNQLPEYIKESEDYADYLKFTAMIGHLFDSILVYIKKFPKTYPIGNSENTDYPKNLLDELLNSFNCNNINFNFQNSNISQYLFDNTEISGTLSSSYFDYGKSILNRFANNLPQIYKSKGSAKSADLIKSIFGIPSELIQIKEYGSPDLNANKLNFYDYEDIVYLTKIEDNNYIKFNNNKKEYTFKIFDKQKIVKQIDSNVFPPHFYQVTSSISSGEFFTGIKTIEFGFKFKGNDYQRDDKIPLMKKIRNDKIDWQIYIKKTQQNESGILVFDFHPFESSITSSIKSDELPFLNGNFYNLMITRDESEILDLDNNKPVFSLTPPPLYYIFENTSSYILPTTASYTSSYQGKFIPQNYKLSVYQYEGSQKNFYSSKTKTIFYTQNEYFSSGSFYIGNYSSSVNFRGNIDKIKVFSETLSDADFEEHSYNINSISIPQTEILYENLLYLWSFDTPIDLWSHTSSVNYVNVPNQNSYYTNSFQAYNFTGETTNVKINNCDNTTEIVSKFPYQFDKVNLIQAINANKFGPNYNNNSKINKIDEFAISNLVPYEYSTTTNDILGDDSNLVGFFIDPHQYLCKKIERFLGKTGITDFIGNPKYLNSQKYPELEEKFNQFAELNEKYIYPQEFYTTYKFYVDFTVFDYIKNIIPNRSSYKKGLIIEPSIFERKKFNYKDVSCTNIDLSTSSMFFDNKAKFDISLNTSSLFYIRSKNVGSKDTNQYNFSRFEINDKIDDRDFIFSKHGNCIMVDGDGYKQKYVANVLTYDYYNDLDDLGKQIVFTSSFNKVNLFWNTGSLVTGSKGIEIRYPDFQSVFPDSYKGDESTGYSIRHLSKISRPGSRQSYLAVSSSMYKIINGVKTDIPGEIKVFNYTKGKNDSNTTINRQGLLNQSSPVTTIPGYIRLRLSSSNFPINGTAINDGSSVNSLFKPLPLTASMENSSSLNNLIMNL